MLVVWAVMGSAPQVLAEPELVNGIQAVVHDSVVTLLRRGDHDHASGESALRPLPLPNGLFLKKLSDARNDSLEQLIERS